MAHLPPSVALSSCETALRQLLTFVLEQKHGHDWLAAVVRGDRIDKWRGRQEVEERKRTTRGVAAVPSRLIEYAEFYELVDIARKNWDAVSPALGKKAATGALLDRFDDLRNSVAHGRSLLAFEEDLLAGISGEIRNRVTLFMSTQSPSGEHFARIEEVVDSFGNRIDGLATVKQRGNSVRCAQVLHVGDVVTFRCRGTDPHGRKLRWTATVYLKGQPAALAEGDESELSWEVRPEHVSSETTVIIRLMSDSEFHRLSSGADGVAYFIYQITPPYYG